MCLQSELEGRGDVEGERVDGAGKIRQVEKRGARWGRFTDKERGRGGKR